MNPRERMHAAMNLQRPDRVPLMCQPSWGFILLDNPGVDPLSLWNNTEQTYSRALYEVSRKYHFDGILVPAVGLAPIDVSTVERSIYDPVNGQVLTFTTGDRCTFCRDDLPRYEYREPPEVDIDSFDPDTIPERLEYHPPSNHLRMYLTDSPEGRVAEIKEVRGMAGTGTSVHGAMYSPEDYLIDLLGADQALMALLTHPDKCRDILMRFAHAVAGHVKEQIDAGVDAMNLSAPWTGQNFIGPDTYEEIIAPAQKVLADICRENNVFCYCHTCGSIDDRLELIIDIGFHGIECLDPPPLGNVELDDAVRRIGDRAFIKGNIDPVNVLKNGTRNAIEKDVLHRLETGMKAKGFILSTACSMSPGTPPEHVELLFELVEDHGYY